MITYVLRTLVPTVDGVHYESFLLEFQPDVLGAFATKRLKKHTC
jgi:hypothetical protein